MNKDEFPNPAFSVGEETHNAEDGELLHKRSALDTRSGIPRPHPHLTDEVMEAGSRTDTCLQLTDPA